MRRSDTEALLLQMGQHSKQHYVAKSYLRAWSDDGRRVWRLDTRTRAKGRAGLASVAQSTYFNDSFLRVNGQMPDGLAGDLYERRFQVWEDQFLRMRAIAHAVAEGSRTASFAERLPLATCIAVQLLRTAKMRLRIREEVQNDAYQHARPLLRWLPPDVLNNIRIRSAVGSEYISFLQAFLIWQSGIVPVLAADLALYIWVVVRNDSRVSFLTSDAPVCFLTHAPGAEDSFAVANDEPDGAEESIAKSLLASRSDYTGLEIVFPVSPQCALLMFNRADFSRSLGEKDGRVLVAGTESVEVRNIVIAGSALRSVISINEDFGTANAALDYATRTLAYRKTTDDDPEAA